MDMKNFHIYNNFYKIVIDTNMIIFCITFAQCNIINIYKKWLINLDWFEEIFKLENLNLNLFRVQKL